ncbi:MAG: threonine--tRNA ligase [Planctomycetes bacterium]|nr:threonine--tRNA ligase [Planctomycetota bacterium]
MSKEKKTEVIAVRVNGALLDLPKGNESKPAESSAQEITLQMPEGLEILRHSTSHVMADAVKKLFPNAKLAIGPAIENGFYYDFDVDKPFSPEDLVKIEKEMENIVKSKKPFVRKEVSRDEALKFMDNKGEFYKTELISELGDQKITLYQHGDFTDLCRGPHIPDTGYVKAFKLLSATGAYWRGDEKKKMLQRIYGTVFPSKKELDDYLKHLEEVKKRDHRRLGKDLDLFSIQYDDAGPGLVFWHPKGALIRKIIEDYWRDEHLKNGYELIYAPHIARIGLWKTSGHWDFYKENMYSPMDIDGQEYILKPMNCPGHILVYKTRIRSYRDLPIRWAELGTVYRYERSGVLQGLFRVRGFTQDDAHLFCRFDQIDDEIKGVINFGLNIFRSFGFSDFKMVLSTRPTEKYVGTIEHWDKATAALKKAIEEVGLPYTVAEGEAVFYGPKADIHIKDSLGREWQCFTVQVDFNLPERFDMVYTAQSGVQERPVMLHRALMGSLERFFAILIEHYGGAFPMWLAPVQAIVLPVVESQHNYAVQVKDALAKVGIRAQADLRNERLSQRIREATNQKIPYMLVVGDKEEADKTVAVRERTKGDLGQIKLDAFIEQIKLAVEKKA